MPENLHHEPELSPVKRALYEIRGLRARVNELEQAARQPVAIIGVGLRFPGGATDEESLWRLLSSGTDAIREIPRDRWDWRAYFDRNADPPGTMYTQRGGFLDDVDQFDAAFFGISPREAVGMDPQHRLVLEVGWEALENAGYSPTALHRSATGVFLGIGNSDYGRRTLGHLNQIDAYTGSGNSPAMVAGRLSYVFGLHGPSIAIDTSCSSSLVAVHAACGSLRAGECEIALAGGVNLILSPEVNVAFSKAHMMAPDGRCKTFDAAADGYVRSEGCCIVVLKRLADAVADRDRILAVIRGSAVNHDGRSGGLTAPSGPAQAAVIRKAFEMAGIDPAEVDFVEAHGTGTSLGDPIEVDTLASVMGEGRPAERPLMLGSVKTNIGHAEAASGIAGLIKAVQVLQHRTVPPHLHLNRRSTHIAWDRIPITVPTEKIALPSRGRPLYASVSSFGFSGTNAHVVLQEAPEQQPANSSVEKSHILTLSARTASGVDALRAKYARLLRNTSLDLADICFTANTGRNHFDQRFAAVGETAEQIVAALESDTRSFRARSDTAPGLCFLYTGQGSQYAGMGEELYRASSVYREAVDRCAAAWKQQTGESLDAMLRGPGEVLKRAQAAQPALFAVEYGLSELWRSWGVEPSLLLGHSLGEYVAAVVAGVFSLEDGLRLVRARAELMDSLSSRGVKPGGMRAVQGSAERVRPLLRGLEAEVGIAAINGPESVVISGAEERLEELGKRLEKEGLRTRALEVTHAFHSPLLEPILEEFERRAQEVRYSEPRLRLISNLTGRVATGREMCHAGYWREHMRSSVQFHAGVQTALASGCSSFLEIGPQPHLRALITRTNPELENSIHISMRRNVADLTELYRTLARLYMEGQSIHWAGVYQQDQRSRVALPTYPFERQRYWQGVDAQESAHEIWRRAVDRASAQSRSAPFGTRPENFPARWESLERLTVAVILDTLRRLGALTLSAPFDVPKMIERCRIAPSYAKLMRRWLDTLCRHGHLQSTEAGFMVHAPAPTADLTAAWRDAESALSEDSYLLTYLQNCASHLAGVLTGKTSPLEMLFPAGSPDLARNLYEHSGGTSYANAIVAAAVQGACAAKPAHMRLRILELGGGTGATTAAVLPGLPVEDVSYDFTDISELILEKAREHFGMHGFVRYGIVDIESDADCSNHRHEYDVVIAANVLHATRDLRATLIRLKTLLVPGGTAILLETTRDLAWHDITIALVDGWQKPEDDLRSGSPLMSAGAWIAALREAGFETAIQVPETGSVAESMGLNVLLAKAPSDVVGAQSGLEDAVRQTAWLSSAPNGAAHEENHHPSLAANIRFAEIPAADRRDVVLQIVTEHIAGVLRLRPDAIQKRDRLMDLGLDSLMAVELRNKLGASLRLADLPATLIFDYPTPDAIAGYLLRQIEPQAEEQTAAAISTTPEKIYTATELDTLTDEAVAELLRSRLAQ